MTGAFDEILAVTDFAPGAWSPVHTHPGPVLVTVLEGELTVRSEGRETIYHQGQTILEEVGSVRQAGNASSKPTRLLIACVLPTGSKPAVHSPGVQFQA